MVDDYNGQLRALAPRAQAFDAAVKELNALAGQYNRAISPDFVERMRRGGAPQEPERPPLSEYEAGGLRLQEMARAGNVLERLIAGAALGGKAAATAPFTPPSEGGEKDIAARIGQITALPFSVPFSTLTNALVQAGAISPQTAEELAKLAIAALPATMGPEANAARASFRLLRQDPGAAMGAMRPLSAWDRVMQGPEGPQVSRLVEALQQTAARGATPGERAAAEAGLDRILQRYGLTREDIPPNLRVQAEPMQPRPASRSPRSPPRPVSVRLLAYPQNRPQRPLPERLRRPRFNPSSRRPLHSLPLCPRPKLPDSATASPNSSAGCGRTRAARHTRSDRGPPAPPPGPQTRDGQEGNGAAGGSTAGSRPGSLRPG